MKVRTSIPQEYRFAPFLNLQPSTLKIQDTHNAILAPLVAALPLRNSIVLSIYRIF